jgi:hypothetical protein
VLTFEYSNVYLNIYSTPFSSCDCVQVREVVMQEVRNVSVHAGWPTGWLKSVRPSDSASLAAATIGNNDRVIWVKLLIFYYY